MKKRAAAFTNLSFAAANVLLTLVTGLLLVPLYLRYFDLATYGAWLASGGVISAIAVLESGLSSVLTRRLATAQAGADAVIFARLTTSGLSLALTAGLAVMAIGVAVSPFVPAWVHAPPTQREALTLAIKLTSIAAGASIFHLNLGAITQAWQQTVAPGVISTTGYLANVVAILISLKMGAGVVSLAVGRLVLATTYNLGYVIYIGPQWRRKSLGYYRPNLLLAREIWREARTLLVAQIANTVSSNLESLVAAAMISPQVAAIVNLTGRLVTTARMFLEAVASAGFAGVAIAKESFDASAFQRVLTEYLTVAIVLSGLGAGAALALSPSVIPLWVGPAAFGGILLLILIAVSDTLAFRKGMLATVLIAGGQTALVARISLFEAVLRPIFLVSMVYALGIYGVPVSGILAYGIPLVLLSRLAQARLHLPVVAQLKAGVRGFTVGVASGLVWLTLVPRALTWFMVAVDLVLFGMIVVAISLAADRGWRLSVRHNASVLLRRFGAADQLANGPPIASGSTHLDS
jgi:O-antigen/teichoic acid export membrane protein